MDAVVTRRVARPCRAGPPRSVTPPMTAVDYYLVSAARRATKLRSGRTYTFGREEGCDIVLQDALVSRRHAELRWSDEGFWYVQDLNSRNGIAVNNTRVTQPTRLDDGTQLQIGGQIYRLHLLPPGGDPNSLFQQAPQISSLETMGPGFSLNDLATQGATYTGAVTEGGVMELLQFFASTAKSGRLDLLGGPAGSSVWMDKGNPVHATFGAASGIEALIGMANQPPPKFAFHADAEAPQRTLTGGANAVLMEVARQMDEKKR